MPSTDLRRAVERPGLSREGLDSTPDGTGVAAVVPKPFAGEGLVRAVRDVAEQGRRATGIGSN